MLRAGALFVLLPLTAFAQDGGAVQGTVTNGATHAGLGGVAVTLWTQQAVHYNTTTNDSGAWRIEGMKPGRYYSRFEKSGFVEPPHGDPFANAPLAVTANGNPLHLDAELVPLGTVRGRVVDPEGKPAADIEVGFGKFDSVKTDAGGQFVLHDERPGSYLLLARPKAVPAETGHRDHIVATFYPSAIERAQAVPIVVRGGDDLSGFEIRLRTAPVFRVRGVVLDETGKPLRDATVQLLSRSGESAPAGQMRFGLTGTRFFFGVPGAETEEAASVSAADGTFEFPAVRAGDWELRAEGEPKRDSARNLSLPSTGRIPAVVTDHDLDDVIIRLPETFTLQATLDWGDAPPARLDPRGGVMLLLLPGDGRTGVIPQVPITKGDALRFENVPAGRYRVVPLPGVIPGYYASAVMMEGQDILGKQVDLSAATPPLRLVYKPNAGTVRGSVTGGEAGTVLFWPRSDTTIDMVRGAQAGPNGTFEIPTIAPGDYYLVAVDRQNLDSGLDSVIRSLIPSATPVHVDEAGSPTVSLPLTHMR